MNRRKPPGNSTLDLFASVGYVKRRHVRAAKFARMGAEIVPLAPYSKERMIESGGGIRLRSADEVRDFFLECPSANYGVSTASASDLLVMNVNGIDGRRSLSSIQRKYEQIPATGRVNTPGDGIVYISRVPKGVQIPTCTIALGLTVLAEGGYAVGPRNIHPNGGSIRRLAISPKRPTPPN